MFWSVYIDNIWFKGCSLKAHFTVLVLIYAIYASVDMIYKMDVVISPPKTTDGVTHSCDYCCLKKFTKKFPNDQKRKDFCLFLTLSLK